MDAAGSPKIDLSHDKIREQVKEFVRENPAAFDSTYCKSPGSVYKGETSLVNKNLLASRNDSCIAANSIDFSANDTTHKGFKLEPGAFDDNPLKVTTSGNNLKIGFHEYASVTFKPRDDGSVKVKVDSEFARD